MFFALFFRKSIAKPVRYYWEEPNYNEDDDPFLKHFDEHGNFIENIEVSEEQLEDKDLQIKYDYKSKKDS